MTTLDNLVYELQDFVAFCRNTADVFERRILELTISEEGKMKRKKKREAEKPPVEDECTS
jgi:hypothetical protein